MRIVAAIAFAGFAKFYSIAGMTRSGGLWPSAKVLMLMMTFSPMSMRPSMRGRAHMRQQHHVLELQQLRIDRRLVLEHVEARAGELARFQHARQRVLVDDFAARRVDDEGGRISSA